MKDYKNEHQLMRRRVWSDAFSATASAYDCKTTGTASKYADAALVRFDELFRELDAGNELSAQGLICQRDHLLNILQLIRNKVRMGEADIPQRDIERIDAALAEAEGGAG